MKNHFLHVDLPMISYWSATKEPCLSSKAAIALSLQPRKKSLILFGLLFHQCQSESVFKKLQNLKVASFKKLYSDL